jgi:hypothetical protein
MSLAAIMGATISATRTQAVRYRKIVVRCSGGAMSEIIVRPIAMATIGPPPITVKALESHVNCREKNLK